MYREIVGNRSVKARQAPPRFNSSQGESHIVRRPMAAPPPSKDGPRVNDEIRAPRVLLIDENGEKQGEMPLNAALEAATEAGLDLVEVAPQGVPPVCKIMDYGKFRFEEQKKKAAARKNAKAVEIKEIKVRPGIDDHDYEVKLRAIERFFEEGDKVKVTLRFRGRELAHTHLGMEVLQRMRQHFEDRAKVEQEPRFEGRQVVMVMAPR